MTPFYISKVIGDTAVLDGEEAHHCLKVMRKKLGEEIIGIDGAGAMLVCRLLGVARDQVQLEIVERHVGWGEKSQRIALLVSPLHKPDRFEWLIEKAVELGATDIYPYFGKHTVKTGFRKDRMERIMAAALKQSMRSQLPTLHEPAPLQKVLAPHTETLSLVGHAELGKPLASYAIAYDQVQSVRILIGPEGDFAPEEMDAAMAAGFLPLSLGANRLRSETAAIHLLGIVKHCLGY